MIHTFLPINTKFINTISLKFLFFLNTLLNTSQPQIFEIFLKNVLALAFSKQKFSIKNIHLFFSKDNIKIEVKYTDI